MKQQLRSLHFFFIILACSIFVFAGQSAVYSVMAQMFQTEKGFQEGTSVANVSLSGMLPQQAQEQLEKTVQAWLSEEQIKLTYEELSISVPAALFSFDIANTVQNVQNGSVASLEVQLDEQQFTTLLEENLRPELMSSLRIEELRRALVAQAEQLETANSISLLPFLNTEGSTQIVAQASMQLSEAQQQRVQQWIANYPLLTVEANSELSMLQLVKDKGMDIDDATLSVIASLMYKAVLTTNFTVTERSISRELPAYAELGEEARVEKDTSDFAFTNENEVPYSISFAVDNNVFSISIDGLPFGYTYSINKSNVTSIPERTIVQADVSDPVKDDAVAAPSAGKEGYEVDVYREGYDRKGNRVTNDLVANDYYLQINEIRNIQITPSTEATTTQSAAADATTQSATTQSAASGDTTAGTSSTSTQTTASP